MPSDEEAAAAVPMEFYRQLYICYSPSRCNFDELAQYFAPGSDELENYRRPLETFWTDQLTITNLDEIKVRVDHVDLQEVHGKKRSGTVVLCQLDPALLVDANGQLLSDKVTTRRLEVIVAKVPDEWKIVQVNSEDLEPGNQTCGF